MHIYLVHLTEKEIIEQERDIILNGMRSGRFRFSAHALERCGDRLVTRQDVIEVAFNHDSWKSQENGTHLFIGTDVDGVGLQVVAAYDGGILIISVI